MSYLTNKAVKKRIDKLLSNNASYQASNICISNSKTRKQDIESSEHETLNLHNIYRWEQRTIGSDTVTLFSDGIDLEETDCDCLKHCVDDIDDWICGALLGQINRGKKRMLKEWQPIILDDPDISTMPATEEGLINMIVARDDYKARNN